MVDGGHAYPTRSAVQKTSTECQSNPVWPVRCTNTLANPSAVVVRLIWGPKGWEEATLNRQDALAEISAARKLRFQPGTKWGIQIPTTYSSTW